MVNQISTLGAALKVPSKTSSKPSPSAASYTKSNSNSSILRSAFSPSCYQLCLFASIIQGLGSQHLRIHNTLSGQIQCDHAISSRANVNCLDWGLHRGKDLGDHHKSSRKKRKRDGLVNGSGDHGEQDIAVAFGTSDSTIQIFSPTEGRVIKSLGAVRNIHKQGVKDFRFANDPAGVTGWSLGSGDGKLVQWDLQNDCSLIVLSTDAACSVLSSSVSRDPPILCASHAVFIRTLVPAERAKWPPFQASAKGTEVHSLIPSSTAPAQLPSFFLAAADAERSISVFSVEAGKLVGSLIAGNDVLGLAYSGERNSVHDADETHVLAALTKDGLVELFAGPFESFSSSLNTNESLKSQRRKMTRKADGIIRATRPERASLLLPLVGMTFHGNYLIVAWAEAGMKPSFEKMQWRDEGSKAFLLQGTKEIVRSKESAVGGATEVNGIKDMGKSHVDESHMVVVNGGDVEDVEMALQGPEVIDISSGEKEESSADEGSVSELEHNEHITSAKVSAFVDEEMVDADNMDEGASEKDAEPSFGDLLRLNAPEPINVANADYANSQALTAAGPKLRQLPSGKSLGTVLTQSLRTNDMGLLETCFSTKDLDIVRATIERLDSSLAAALLQRLSERLHSRPGRAGTMMVWVQWTLVVHGGYLAGQPEVMKKLRSLHRVVKDRANSLQPLLALKGKLDMLEAQMNLRRSMQARSRMANGDDDDNDEGVIYVEGQEESDSEAEHDRDDEANAAASTIILPKRTNQTPDVSDAVSDQEEDGDLEDGGMRTTTNGADARSEDESLSSSGGDDLLDDEASETDNDSDDGASADEVDYDDVSSSNKDSDDSEAEKAPPAKRMAKAGLTNGYLPSPKD